VNQHIGISPLVSSRDGDLTEKVTGHERCCAPERGLVGECSWMKVGSPRSAAQEPPSVGPPGTASSPVHGAVTTVLKISRSEDQRFIFRRGPDEH